MMHDMESGMMRKVDPIQLIVSITVETFGYFLLLPALQYIGIANPLSPASLAARERMVIGVLGDGLGMAGPESGTGD